ncbi:MAG: tetratricopeptide repeat protein [Litorimonas sp.]
MVDFISEVEEELRKDDYNKFLRKFGPLIIGLLIGVVLVVAFLEWRDWSEDRTARAASLSYLQADDLLQDGNPDAASRAFLALADVAPDGYAGLSLMRAAIIAADAGNGAEAVRLYDAASARFDNRRHADLAALKAAYVVANRGDWNDVEQRAGRLAETDAPYEFLARELLATALANLGRMDEARAEFTYLDTIPGVPQTVARRAEQALVIMSAGQTGLPAPEDTIADLPTTAETNGQDSEESDDDTTP